MPKERPWRNSALRMEGASAAPFPGAPRALVVAPIAVRHILARYLNEQDLELNKLLHFKNKKEKKYIHIIHITIDEHVIYM